MSKRKTPGHAPDPQAPAERATDKGCTLPEGATKSLPGQKFMQSAMGAVIEGPIALIGQAAALTSAATHGQFGESLRASTDAALTNIDACRDGSVEGKLGHFTGAVAPAVVMGGNPLNVGRTVANELGLDPAKAAKNLIKP